MKNSRLKYIVSSQLLKSFFLPSAISLFLVLLIFFFQINKIIENQYGYFIDDYHNSIEHIMQEKAQDINHRLQNIEISLLGIQNAINRYYENIDYSSVKLDNTFEKNERGFWFNTKSHDSSVVFMPQANPTTKDFIDATNLNKIDSFIVPLVDKNDFIVAAWMNQENYLVRYYPFFDMKNILKSDMNLKSFNFYYEADPKHNPDMKNIWTTPYLDPAMNGWLISRVAPIKNKNQFYGVFGIDISIEYVAKSILKPLDDQDIKTFLTDSNGKILAMNQYLRTYFDISDLDDYENGKSLSSEVKLSKAHNILESTNKSLSSKLKMLFKGSTHIKIEHKNSNHYIYSEVIPSTKWRMFYVVDEKNLYSKLDLIKHSIFNLSIYTVIAFLVIFIFVAFNLRKKMKDIAQSISKPIEELSEAAKSISTISMDKRYKNIEEITTLYSSFNKMTETIVKNQDELEQKVNERTIELNEKIETIEKLQEKLIEQNTRDPLTNLFNRRYGNEVLKRESQEAISHNLDLSVVMLDIDLFKSVNDTYGHQVGDLVLIKLSTIIKSHIKKRDVAIRYGGEEFLLILPNLDKESAYLLVESINMDYKKAIQNNSNFNFESSISAGIAQFPNDSDDINKVINFADQALYISKKSGRNKITIY